MSNSFLLHEEDMMKETDFPATIFFNAISDKSDFVRIISHLSNGIGYGYDFAVCLFPSDEDIESEKFGDGVEFSLDNGEAVVLSYEEYYYYLKKACTNYLKKYPEEKNVIDQILEKVRRRHNIME